MFIHEHHGMLDPNQERETMSVKLIVLYTCPDDPDAFEQHYRETHAPLVSAIPGLVNWDSALIGGAADGGEQTYHRIAELHFADDAALRAALGSDEGRQTAEDFGHIAPAGSRMFVAKVD
jgi:uncharacterized protein (TIGR02118 family)